jgi:hypothetical protein
VAVDRSQVIPLVTALVFEFAPLALGSWNACMTVDCHCLCRNQVAADVEIYATDNNGAQYTAGTGADMHCVGTIRITIADGQVDDPSSYFLRVKLKFGMTELQVTAVDDQTGTEQETRLNFKPRLVPLA